MARRRLFLTLVLVFCGLVLAIVAGAAAGRRHVAHRLHNEIIRAMEGAFDGTVALEDLELSVGREVRILGRGLVLRRRGSDTLPPLIRIDVFSVEAGIVDVFRSPRRIRQVTLTGLAIHIPPRKEKVLTADRADSGAPPAGGRPTDSRERAMTPFANGPRFLLETIHADGTRLVIHPKDTRKEPLLFELYRLTLSPGADGHPMTYKALLKNAKPPGLISTEGEFGPWRAEDPGDTHLTGSYVFSNADLSVFRGLSGTLFSTGGFRGVLRRIEAWGATDTPDFTVRTGAQPVRLETEYKAIIDGTNGDTLLQPVIARFGSSEVVSYGGVYQREGSHGKSVVLDTVMEDGRIEDVMRLLVPGTPPLVGGLSFTSKMDLPPGDLDVVDALQLQGTFGVEDAEFASPRVQGKIDRLSMRSRGQLEETTDERIVSDLGGVFVLRDAVASFSKLTFRVPGARVSIEGDYGLTTQALDFQGRLFMQVKISKTQKGIKSLLLKIVDPFLAGKSGGTELPIKITGTRADPKIGQNFWGDKKKSR